MQRRRIGVALTAAAALGAAAFAFLRPHAQVAPFQAQPAVALATARLGTFVLRVDAAGRVGAPAGSETKAVFAVPGIVKSIDVRVGQLVAAGDVLAQLDVTGLTLAAAQAQADAAAAAASYGGGAVPSAVLRSAQARLAAAQARLDALARTQVKLELDRRAWQRQQQLYAAGVAAQKDVEAARAQLIADRADASSARAQARAEYQQAQADLRTAQAQQQVLAAQSSSARARAAAALRDYRNGTLVAPVSGVVNAIYKHPGEAVDMATPVVAIGPAAQAEATLDVPAAEAQRVRVGDSVEVWLAGDRARTRGRVIGIVPAVDPRTQASTVVVSGVPAGALAGDAVQATIVVGAERGVIVPQSAIVQDPQTGKTLVFVQAKAKDGEPKFDQREVRVANSDAANAEIAAGLRAGEQVAAQGAFALLAPPGPAEAPAGTGLMGA